MLHLAEEVLLFVEVVITSHFFLAILCLFC